jgi:multiple sugar transport system permease protein
MGIHIGKKSGVGSLKKKEAIAGLLLITPWIIGFLLFLVVPIIFSIYASFTWWTLINPPPVWIGLQNYEAMFRDRNTLWSLGVTVRYMAMTLIPFLVLALLLALLLNQKLRGMNVFRTVFYLPSIISGVAVAILWASLLNPEIGAINQVLRFIGVSNPPRWLLSSDWALPALALMGLWGIGGSTIIYLSGLQNIPAELYDAATVDGANAIQKFFSVTLPMLSSTLFFLFITGIIGAFQIFTPAYILGGASSMGSSRAIMFYVLHIYMEGFRKGKLGYASALAWLLVIIAAVVVVLIYRRSEQYVYYETSGDDS